MLIYYIMSNISGGHYLILFLNGSNWPCAYGLVRVTFLKLKFKTYSGHCKAYLIMIHLSLQLKLLVLTFKILVAMEMALLSNLSISAVVADTTKNWGDATIVGQLLSQGT